jgi:hypothetical protein
MLVWTKDWKASIPLEASATLRSYWYWNTVADGGAGNVVTSIDVVIPNDPADPLMA